MRQLHVPRPILTASQQFLREKAAEPPLGHEGVVLWLGGTASGTVDQMIIPEQETTLLSFDVPMPERQRIARALVGTGRAVLAQVHSHPAQAFHSPVDDQRALPRRVGSISLVIPNQGRNPSLLDGAALYVLGPDGTWATAPISLIVEHIDDQ
jgi:hypothetical protein